MKKWLLAGLLALGAGCVGSAQVRYQDANGGVLTLQGDEQKSMEDAYKRMAAHCGPAGYSIVKRETVVVGQEQYTNTNKGYAEQEDRSRDEDTVGSHDTDTEYGEDRVQTADAEAHSYDGRSSSHDQASATATDSKEGYESTTEDYAESKREDESTQRTGNESTNTVSGTRDVNEVRLHYACGGKNQTAGR